MRRGNGIWIRQPGFLYFYPSPDVDLRSAVIEIAYLPQILRLVGSQERPVHHLFWRGFPNGPHGGNVS